jgi:hypothetical protein
VPVLVLGFADVRYSGGVQKVHPGDDLKAAAASVGPKIAGVQLNALVHNTNYHSVATPGHHF